MAILVFRCADCETVWNWEDEAQICCAPYPHDAYQCETCSAVYDDEMDADVCCLESAENDCAA